MGVLNEAFKRVPKLGSGWRYVPLHRLPEGSIIQISFNAGVVKDSLDYYIIDQAFEAQLECDAIWPTLLGYGFPGFEVISLKPLHTLLAPSSTLRANFFHKQETFTLETGIIQNICVEWEYQKYVLDIKDFQ